MTREQEHNAATDIIGFLAAFGFPYKNARNILWQAYDRHRVMNEDDYQESGKSIKAFAGIPKPVNDQEKPN